MKPQQVQHFLVARADCYQTEIISRAPLHYLDNVRCWKKRVNRILGHEDRPLISFHDDI